MSQGNSRWVIRECREVGKEGRVWELTEGGLTVGRSSDRDIQLLVRMLKKMTLRSQVVLLHSFIMFCLFVW